MWLSDETLAHLRHVADEPDLAGTRYRILEAIGQGGMATIYRAHDLELDRDIALKVLRAPELAETLARRMADEAKILARLEHPGIVPVHDAGVLPDGRVWYAMKLVRGMRLDALAAGNSDSNERLRVFQRICEPVAFAHAHGVLHRDLKPENIMVGAFGEVLVLDWGVAKLAGGSRASSPDAPAVAQAGDVADQTQHGTRLGTPGWMAPEQERGNSADIDARTDVFALGIVLRYLLGLQPGAPRPDALVRPPARLRAIADKAAAAAREDRYDSVDALAADVRRFQDGLPVSAYPEPLYERALRIASKYRTPILLVLTYLLVRILLIFTR